MIKIIPAWKVTRGPIKWACYAASAEDAQRKAAKRFGGSADRYIVERMSPPAGGISAPHKES
jgi:hypothetical protein